MTDNLKLAQAASFISTYGGLTNWSPEDVDKLEIKDLDEFKKVLEDCRFYYKRDPIASTVLNKMVEIGITKLVVDQGNLTDNEYRVFLGVKDKIQEFIESCALEYLISGLVIPEIRYAPVTKKELQILGVKKYNTLGLPISMWLRDPTTLKIKATMFPDRPSYFIVIPEEMILFIQREGVYADGNEDKELWQFLRTHYPEFIKYVKNGNKEVPYRNDLITRRKVITGSAYPIPYLYPALESLKHKRNLRKMDYSIASRVITAIMLVRLGNDEYPITEEDSDAFDAIRDQMMWRNSSNRDVEKVFQLFANHTLQIEWVFPDTAVLLDEKKYEEVNQDIFWGLGFPRILTTGETQRSQSSNASIAIVSPEKSMISMQNQLLDIVKDIVYNISNLNGFKETPGVRFSRINLNAISEWLQVLSTMFDSGIISRETYAEEFGFSYEEEFKKKKVEDTEVEKLQPKEESVDVEQDTNKEDPTTNTEKIEKQKKLEKSN